MHISEGVLSAPVLLCGWGIALVGLQRGLKKLPWQHLTAVGILSAAFFVASLIQIPLRPGSVHLVLNGLLGAILGSAAFPAIFAALLLQALLFQFGGLTSLGVNLCIMALPAVLLGRLCRPYFMDTTLIWGLVKKRSLAAFACGALAVLGGALLGAGALAFSGEAFWVTAWFFLLTQIPIMLLEGIITAFTVAFLARVMPEILTFQVGHAAQ